MTRTPLLKSLDATVRVPASTSNLGPGFDCFGCALKLTNTFHWKLAAKGADATTRFTGPEAAGLPASGTTLAHWAFGKLLEAAGHDPAPVVERVCLDARVNIPQARGLGSSSTALVAGLFGANALLKRPMPREALLELAVALEGHPDNVAPAILGGLVAAVVAPGGRTLHLASRLHPSLRFVLLIPDYHVSTSDARKALPKALPIGDAIANASRTPLLLDALRTGRVEHLWELMQDRIHQPYRKPLYRSYDEFERAAAKAGAFGFCVSGAGPALLAVASRESAERIARALERTRRTLAIPGRTVVMPSAGRGTVVTAR